MVENTFVIGFLLVIAGGLMEGSFSLPLKFTPKWNWENIWGAGSFMAFLLVPWTLAFITIPNLLDVYRVTPILAILAELLFGIGWGMGGIFFGLGLSALGLSLGLSLIMGLIAIGGSIIPLIMQHPDQIFQPAGLVLTGGIVVMVVGIITCSKAGQMKEASLTQGISQQEVTTTSKVPFRIGLMFCIAAGLLSALVNFGLIFGTDIIHSAVQHGVNLSTANNAIWALVFTANYLVNVGYCVYLIRRNRSYKNFFKKGTGHYWAWAVFMGILWPGGIVIYGIGATRIGELGAFLSFPVMLICSILAGNILGTLTGEWSGVGLKPKRIMIIGVFLLFLAIFILGYSNSLVS
jgi:L-rhamnose-H+ transport protein